MGQIKITKFLLRFLLLFFAVPFFFIAAILILTVLALLYPYKLLVFVIAKLCRRHHLIDFVHGESGAMAVDKIHTLPTFNLLYFFVLDGVIPIDRFREIFSNRIINKTDISGSSLVYGRFQQFWVNFMGYHFWRWDTEFGIENHIKPSMDLYTRKDLPKLMSHLLPEPFKKGQSPWEITLLYNYNENGGDTEGVQKGPGKMVIILKIHHALADGFSLLNVFQRDLPLKLKPLGIPHAVNVEHSFWKKCFWMPLTLWQYLYCAIESYDFRNTWIFPIGLKGGGKSGQKYYTSITSGIEVSTVCAIKNKYNVSYLAVLVHCLFEGVRTAMERDGQKIPDQTGFIFTRPKPNHPEGLNNHLYITMTTVPLKKMSAASRLQEIEARLKEEKESVKPIAINGFAHLISHFPAPLLSLLTRIFHPRGFSYSNFPVPKDVTVIDGSKVTDLFVALGSMTSQRTATVMAFGDGGKQSIVVSVDESAYSSQEEFEKLGDYIRDEFNNLAEPVHDVMGL